MHYLLSVLLVCLVLVVVSVGAIFEEQIGEHDWIIRSNGFVRHSIFHQKRLVLGTHDAILTSINTVTGNADWRVALPKHTSIEQLALVESKNLLFTVTTTPCLPLIEEENEVALDQQGRSVCRFVSLRAWNMLEGRLVFDQSLNSTSIDIDEKKLRTDLSFTHGDSKCVVMVENALFFVNVDTGSLAWSYVPAASPKLALASLVPGGDHKHVAVACVLNDHGTCTKSVLLTADHDNKQVSSLMFSPLADVAVSNLKCLLSSTKTTSSFSPDDVLFGPSSSGLVMLHLANGKINTLAWPTPVSSQETIDELGVFFLKTEQEDDANGALSPSVSRCVSSSTAGRSCASFMLQGSNTLLPLLACSGSYLAKSGFERDVRSAHIGSSVSCTSASAPVVGDAKTCKANAALCSDKEVSIIVQSVSSIAAAANDKSVQSLQVSLPRFSSLWHVAAQRFNKAEKASSKDKPDLRVLVVTSAGTTMMIQQQQGDKKSPVLWKKEEAVARIRQAVFLEGRALAAAAVSADHMLDLETRLVLQAKEGMEFLHWLQEELVQAPASIGNYVLDAVSGITNTLAGKKGGRVHKVMGAAAKAKAVSQAKRFGFDKRAVCLAKGAQGQPVVFGLDLLAGDVAWLIEVPLERDQHTLMAKMALVGRSEVALVLALQGGEAGTHTKVLRIDDQHPMEASTESWPGAALSVFAIGAGAHHHQHGQFLIMMHDDTSSREVFVVPYPRTHEFVSTGSDFVHHLDKKNGLLQTFKIGQSRNDQKRGLPSLALEPIASASFSPTTERIVVATHPALHDPINSRSIILGDDSVLLKYSNPHTLLVATVSPPAAAFPYFNPKDDAEASAIRLHVSLIDSVSARIIYRGTIESGSAPVHAVLVENNLVITYWNAKAKRTELSSVSLFEGMIDRYGLTPFASKASASAAAHHQRQSNLSAFTSTMQPIAMQKTYVLPRAVTAASHSVTHQGIANKNILLSLSSGQVLALDTRLISPRRPMTEPSMPEREEGLSQYNPFVQFNPFASLTFNYTVETSIIASAPSRLESSSLVLSFGGPDVHFNLVKPSGAFDLLSSDFNHPLLTLILGSLALAVWWLKRMSTKKVMTSAWQ